MDFFELRDILGYLRISENILGYLFGANSLMYVPVRIGTTRYKAVRESHGRTYWYVPVHTSTYTQEDKLFPDSSRKSQKR
jgi:hypothetical protein